MPQLEAAVLSAETVRDLVRLATRRRLGSGRRELLLYGIPIEVQNTWPEFKEPTAQIFSDLAHANCRWEHIFAWIGNAELLDVSEPFWTDVRQELDRRRLGDGPRRQPQASAGYRQPGPWQEEGPGSARRLDSTPPVGDASYAAQDTDLFRQVEVVGQSDDTRLMTCIPTSNASELDELVDLGESGALAQATRQRLRSKVRR